MQERKKNETVNEKFGNLWDCHVRRFAGELVRGV